MEKPWRQVHIYEPARKEISTWPLEVKKDLGSILTKLQKGSPVGPPDTDSMSAVAPGAFEIRLKDASGIYRVFYAIKTAHGVVVFHSFKKKAQKTPAQEIATARHRLKMFLQELDNED